MNKFFIYFLLIFTSISAQNNEIESDFYLEDQLYIGITYNILTDLPKSIGQSGFSNSLFLGYIKDLPINKKRNFGFGLGLGYSFDTYFQNIKIHKVNNETLYENFLENENFKNNKIIAHSIESPFEIRLRTSSKANYKFWRLYAGIKFKYNFYTRASYKNNGTQKLKNIKNFNKFNYGLTLGAGNSTWNLHLYYGLKPLFNNAKLNVDETINMKDFKIGLIFYIL